MDLKDRVAVVTGAGNGLGRAYALAFAKHGVKVVVNDFSSLPRNPADAVVGEINKMGGIAIADYNNVIYGDKIIDTAISKFGRIDILVNNAGILKDATFAKMAAEDWDIVLQVHIKGTFACTKAAWRYMQQRKYGRIINITSASGLYGNFGQANYSAAKMAVVGMCMTLAQEGVKYGIHINCVAPLASTKMTEKLLPESLLKSLKPEHVAPIVLYLSCAKCTDTGKIYEVGAGWVAAVRFQRSPGVYIPVPFDINLVESNWNKINNFVEGQCENPQSLQDSIIAVSKNAFSRLNGKPGFEKFIEDKTSTGLKSERIFKIIKAYISGNPDQSAALVSKVASLFQFDITDNGETKLQWVFDFKSSPGSVYPGQAVSPDVVFTVENATFIDICLRKINPQVAFLQGKMKIKGSLAKATKFTPDIFPKLMEDVLESDYNMNAFIKTLVKYDITKEEKPIDRGDELSELAKRLKSSVLYPLLKQHLLSPAGVALVQRVNCIYRLNITSPSIDTPCTFFINLKVSPPTITEVPYETREKYDCCFTMDDEVFLKIATGKMNPQLAFMQGKMKIKGSTQAAMKFSKDMFPKISKL